MAFLMGLGVIGGRLGLTGRGVSGGGAFLAFGTLEAGLPPEDLSKIFRGSLLGLLRRCTRNSTS